VNRSSKFWKFVQRWGSTALSLGFAVAMAVYIIRSGVLDQIDFKHLRWNLVLLLLVTRLISFTIMGLVLAVFVRSSGKNLAFVEWFGISVAGLFVNLITPIAGAAFVRAGYLKVRHGFPVAHYSALFAANVLVNYFTSGVLGLIIVMLLSARTHQPLIWQGVAVMVGVIFFSVIAVLAPIRHIPLPLPENSRIARWIDLALAGWDNFRSQPLLLFRLCGLVIVYQLNQGLSYMLGLLAIGRDAQYVPMLFVSVLSNIVRVTPIRDVFGISEFAGGLSTQMIGLGVSEGVTAALMLRFGNIAVLAVLGPIFVHVLSKRLGGPLRQILHPAGDEPLFEAPGQDL
jgi:hypothetical protein